MLVDPVSILPRLNIFSSVSIKISAVDREKCSGQPTINIDKTKKMYFWNNFFFQILSFWGTFGMNTCFIPQKLKIWRKNFIISEFKITYFYLYNWRQRLTSFSRKMQFVDGWRPSTLLTSIFTAFFITPVLGPGSNVAFEILSQGKSNSTTENHRVLCSDVE